MTAISIRKSIVAVAALLVTSCVLMAQTPSLVGRFASLNLNGNPVVMSSGTATVTIPSTTQTLLGTSTLCTTGKWCITTATLTDTQIKGLPTTAVQVVAASGASTRIKIHSLSVIVKAGSGAYTNIDAGYADLSLLNGGGDYITYPIVVNDNTTTPALSQLTQSFGTANEQVIDVNPSPLTGVGTSGYVVNNGPVYAGGGSGGWSNSAITIKMDNNGAGNLTGGNAANTMKITVYYSIEAL